MDTAYERARYLAVAWAIHGPGSFAIAGDAFERPMNQLLSVFKNSVPKRLREDAARRAGTHPWFEREQILELAQDALTALAASNEVASIAQNFTPDDLAFLQVVAGMVEGSSIPNHQWISDIANADAQENQGLRDAMAEAAQKALDFANAIGDDVDQLPGGDPAPLRASVDELKAYLEAATPFGGMRIRRLEPALDAAQRALVRYAHDGRLIVAAQDSSAAPAIEEARALEVSLDGIGYPIPNALWMHQDARLNQGEVVTRGDAQNIVTASLKMLEVLENRVAFHDQEQIRRKELLETSLSAAGYLLPGESDKRDTSIAEQSPRGTDDQILAIIGSAAEFCRSLEMGVGLRKASATEGRDAVTVAGPALTLLVNSIAKTGVTTAARAIDAAIIDGRRPFHFAAITRAALERNVEGLVAGYDESTGRRAADLLADNAPEEFAQATQWIEVTAQNDIEAVARYHIALQERGLNRADVITVVSDGIQTSRLEDIEFGRAEGILAENTAAIALTKGEAELVMRLVETVDKIVDRAYQHPENYEDAAFPVSMAADAIEAARKLELESGIRPTLSAIAGGRREAAGFSREGAEALDAFIGVSLDAMKAVVAQDDYIAKERDAGSKSDRIRGIDEEASGFDGEGHSFEDDDGRENASESRKQSAEPKNIIGQTMWNGWADRLKNNPVKRNFIAALPSRLMNGLIAAHERIGARGLPLAVAAMAGREGAPSLSALALGIDPSGYASIQEAMGMGLGGNDGRTKASLMEDRVIDSLMKPKMEMGWDDWRVLPEKVKSKTYPWFMMTSVDGHSFPMPAPSGKASDPEYMKKAWAKDLDVVGTGRGDNDAEKRRLMASLARMMKTPEGAPNRDFMSFLARLEDRPIVAPTRNAAEALREVSNGYIRKLEAARTEAAEKLEQARAERMADTRISAYIDRDSAERLLQVWEAAGAKALGMPIMTKQGDDLAIVHRDLPTVKARASDDKPLQSLRDGHQITIVDMAALKTGLAKTPATHDRFELKIDGYKITSYGAHTLVEPKKTLAAAGARVKDSDLVI